MPKFRMHRRPTVSRYFGTAAQLCSLLFTLNDCLPLPFPILLEAPVELPLFAEALFLLAAGGNPIFVVPEVHKDLSNDLPMLS